MHEESGWLPHTEKWVEAWTKLPHQCRECGIWFWKHGYRLNQFFATAVCAVWRCEPCMTIAVLAGDDNDQKEQ